MENNAKCIEIPALIIIMDSAVAANGRAGN
jgi:hypothetical protein